ncbi:unnamed protein product [Moneuplotes crassus]|uniref:Uncharacterized protein n=1 Tax=Euplotes crassus TaxID=5936 RepID=A0AAD1ULQ9_EUPCR|nr:unnamed protein product [Moneuplotes crassus]
MEDSDFSKEEFMYIYNIFMNVFDQESIRFLDGIILGSLLFTRNCDVDTTLCCFKDWQETADSMDIESEKRILFYFSHIRMLKRNREEFSLCKRDEKRIKKIAQNIEISSFEKCERKALKSSDFKKAKTEESLTEKQDSKEEKQEGLKQKSQIIESSDSDNPTQSENIPASKDQDELDKDTKIAGNSQCVNPTQEESVAAPQTVSSTHRPLEILGEAHVASSSEPLLVKRCILCNKNGNDMIQLSECKDDVHHDCLRTLIKTTLFNPSEILRCPILNHRNNIIREDIKKACNEEQLAFYDSCIFIEEFEKKRRVILWCPHCKKLSYKSFKSLNKCRYCSAKVITLKSKLKYGKLVLNSREELNDTSHYRSIQSYIDSCKEQISRCEMCLHYKHKFPDDFLKCNCIEFD